MESETKATKTTEENKVKKDVCEICAQLKKMRSSFRNVVNMYSLACSVSRQWRKSSYKKV
jgi:DNA-binding IscR family transcriptional regulator